MIPIDLNHDGVIDIHDCPFPLGSKQAISWFNSVLHPYLHTQITAAMKAKYGAKVVGAYKGKPLVPGMAGRDQGDMTFLIHKLIVSGISPGGAVTLAKSIASKKYGL